MSITFIISALLIIIIPCQSTIDFRMWRYDDEGSIASAAGWKLATVSQIQSGPLHDDFMQFMADNNNRIISLGTWSTGSNCLYNPSGPCVVAFANPGDCGNWLNSWSAGSLYEFCPHYPPTVATLEQGIDNLGTSGTPAGPTIAVYFRDSEAPTAAPSFSPTFNGLNCEDLGLIKHINWNNLVDEGGDEIPDIDYDISVSSQDMTLTINVELDYLGYSYINNIYGFGTRYHLGFYSFDSDSIISNCDNRMASAFAGKTWADQWRYSEYPYEIHLDSNYYLAYPPSEYWASSMDSTDFCTRIKYSAVFTWQDLRECKSDDGVSSAVTVDIGDQFINMSGKFFVDVVSPVSMDADILYRSYELLSYPFTISIEKSTFTENNVKNIFTFTSSVLDVGKSNDQEDVLEIILLTEAIDQISLSNPVLLASPDYDDSRFTIKNNASDCLTINSDLCAQIWEITVNVECPFTFDGDFAFQFTANCDSGSAQCLNYTATYGSVVSLTAGLTFDDYICSDNLFEISYNSSMVIYEDETFTSPMPANAIALVDDRIFVEVSVNNFNVDSNGYAVLDSKLLNVWLCTSDTGLALDQDDLVNSGCFSSTIDPDGPYRIIINSEPAIEGTRNINDTLNNVVRFSFIIPSTITRDTLFIQTQVSMEFTEDRRRRRLLQSESGGATQMVYESGSIQVMDKPTSTEVISENIVTDNKEEEKESDNGYFYMFFTATSIAMTMVIFM